MYCNLCYLLSDAISFFKDNNVFKDNFIRDDKVSRVDNFMTLSNTQLNTNAMTLFWLGLAGFLVTYVFVKKYGTRSKFRKS